jgi:glycosyltransferase involved in cell wall biosynthesis
MDGILVAPGDSEALARAMRCLADDPDLVERMGAAARRTVQERFSPERHVEGLLCAYRAAGVRT